MAQYDMQLETTEPEEVAEFAIQGVRDDVFWIAPMSDKARAGFVARVDSILNKTTPTVPNVL